MFIAHLPAGYILAKMLYPKLNPIPSHSVLFFTCIMLGAIFPDLDLFYFYFIDHQSVHHHKYFLHWFSFWIPMFLITFHAYKKFPSLWTLRSCLFCSGAILHICLDIFVGDIWLFAPFIDQPYAFFEVSPRYQLWWLNFIFHWSFAIEIGICITALQLYFQKNKS